MNRKWWSVFIPAIAVIWPTDMASAANNSATLETKNETLLKRKIDFKYFFSFNRMKQNNLIYEVRHSSHSSHSSHASHSSHSSHVSGTGLSSYSDPTPPRSTVPESSFVEPNKVSGQIISDVNVRSEPSSAAALVQIAKKGQNVEILNNSGDWVQISFVQSERIVVGWVKMVYVLRN